MTGRGQKEVKHISAGCNLERPWLPLKFNRKSALERHTGNGIHTVAMATARLVLLVLPFICSFFRPFILLFFRPFIPSPSPFLSFILSFSLLPRAFLCLFIHSFIHSFFLCLTVNLQNHRLYSSVLYIL